MWNYSEKIKDHFINPRNVGEIEDATVVGEVGSMAKGEALKLFLKLDDDEVIVQARFKAFGSPSAIASSSALTEMLKGMHIDKAAELTSGDISKYLGGLPEEEMHTSVMGMEALEDAYARHRGIDLDDSEDEFNVCCCYSVNEQKIERAIRDHDLKTIAEITHYTQAGGGCTSCHPDLNSILTRIRAEIEPVKKAEPAPRSTKPGKNMSDLQRMQLVQEVLDRDVRPGLAMDGGDMELVEVKGTEVFINLEGHCVSCSSSTTTMKFFVEDKLRELVDPAITVIDVTKHSSELHAPPMR